MIAPPYLEKNDINVKKSDNKIKKLKSIVNQLQIRF